MRPIVAALFVLVFVGVTSSEATEPLPSASPAEVGFDEAMLKEIKTLVATGLAEKKMPGCVIGLGRQGKIVWKQAYGSRQLEPAVEPMTVDTIFDLASLTKPIATATSIMWLMEHGQLKLDDPVAKHLPGFEVNGKGAITIQDLLTHQSGLIADNPIGDYRQGNEVAYQRINELSPINPLRTKFVYSDVNFITLGRCVEQISGESLQAFTQTHFFGPLGMTETGYLPAVELRPRIAPTQEREGHWMRGEVHDPRAYQLGGIAGHAGLFSTVDDLAIYAQMLLDDGTFRGKTILQPETVKLMTAAYRVPGGGIRGLGWDKRTGYSINRGDAFTDAAFGHGGFTGTVIWIDPELDLFFIFLSNRVHPNGKGLVNPLAGKIATVISQSLQTEPQP
ncbi:serine hydrolase [bacterium]|nr:serine hydrolase [bacterium]